MKRTVREGERERTLSGRKERKQKGKSKEGGKENEQRSMKLKLLNNAFLSFAYCRHPSSTNSSIVFKTGFGTSSFVQSSLAS